MFLLALVLFTFSGHAQDQPMDMREVQEALEKLTLAPTTQIGCPEKIVVKENHNQEEKLEDLKSVSLNYCFNNLEGVKVKGTTIMRGQTRCEVPVEFLTQCRTHELRDIAVKEIKHQFANTKSSSHIPPRGWTTHIVLDRLEEEALEFPEARPIEIKCYTGDKMATLKDFKKIFKSTLRFD